MREDADARKMATPLDSDVLIGRLRAADGAVTAGIGADVIVEGAELLVIAELVEHQDRTRREQCVEACQGIEGR
jgi:hypothetical protein